jgi:predicted NAD-dependent protein-ADP-ribosyltransferase YbiA (DUF1768 family)
MKTRDYFYESMDINTQLTSLSGFYSEDIIYDGKVYRSSEHMYQSLKYVNTFPEYTEVIRNIRTPYATKLLGIQHITKKEGVKWKIPINNIIKKFQKKGLSRNQEDLDLMRIVLNEKFNQSQIFKEALLSTIGNIECHSLYDKHWSFKECITFGYGCNAERDYTGYNYLCRLLTELRDKM